MVVEPGQLKMIDARDGNNCHRYQVLGGGRCNPFMQAPSSPFHPSTDVLKEPRDVCYMSKQPKGYRCTVDVSFFKHLSDDIADETNPVFLHDSVI